METARKPFIDEEWLPVLLGAVILVLVLLGVRPQLPSFKWRTAGEFAIKAAQSQPALLQLAGQAEAEGQPALAEAARTLGAAVQPADRAASVRAARGLEEAAKAASADGAAELGRKAAGLAKSVGEAAGQRIGRVVSAQNLLRSLVIGLACLLLAGLGVASSGGKVPAFLTGFPVVYAISWAAQLIAGNAGVSSLGLEYVIFALLIGLLISNTVGVPAWLQEAVRTEFYIKTGLVLMGAGILLPEILQAGLLGILQALGVVFVVWYSCYWVAGKLKVDKEFAVILSSAVSICGVSAAIATCGAINGDKKKLSYVISLTLIVAMPMMILMPWVVRLLGLSDFVAGAWIGGTLDNTGSVVAAVTQVSDRAMRIGTIVKFSQNVLIGVAAFVLSVWWALSAKVGAAEGKNKSPGARVIWDRFPKFVLGFLAASLVFSFLLNPTLVIRTKPLLGGLRNTWFALAFVSIGLETRFSGLFAMGKGKPALAFLAAQAFNIVWTLLLAWLLFGGKLLPLPGLK